LEEQARQYPAQVQEFCSNTGILLKYRNSAQMQEF